MEALFEDGWLTHVCGVLSERSKIEGALLPNIGGLTGAARTAFGGCGIEGPVLRGVDRMPRCGAIAKLKAVALPEYLRLTGTARCATLGRL